MKKRIVIALAVLFIGLLISGCQGQVSIRNFVAQRYPEATLTSVDGSDVLWLVSQENEILLVRYVRGGDLNLNPLEVIVSVEVE